MKNKQKRTRRINWLQNIYYIGTLASLIFIMAQAYYARRSVIQSSEWEKAKITISNIEQFKEALNISPLSKDNIWLLGNDLWADASTVEGAMLADTLVKFFLSLFDSNTDASEELFRMIEAMDAFAYPIIMGYANEMGSYQSVIRQYSTYGNFIFPVAFHQTKLIGLYAKLLYRLWRIRSEMDSIDAALERDDDDVYNHYRKRKDHMLCYEETDFSKASFQQYRKKLDGKLKEIQKEIEVFRKNSMK